MEDRQGSRLSGSRWPKVDRFPAARCNSNRNRGGLEKAQEFRIVKSAGFQGGPREQLVTAGRESGEARLSLGSGRGFPVEKHFAAALRDGHHLYVLYRES